MKYVIFSDLDDTLFCSLNKHKQKQKQTQKQDKNQNINENLKPIAYLQDNSPICFADSKQQQFLNIITQQIQNSILIPTTARNFDAFSRVKNIQFTNEVILNYGGIILTNYNAENQSFNIDNNYYNLIENQAKQQQNLLTDYLHFLEFHNNKIEFNYEGKIKIVYDFDLPFYLVVKAKNNNINLVEKFYLLLQQQLIKNNHQNDFILYFNANNLALIPKYLNKKNAVEYLIKNKYNNDLTFGVGDAVVDIDFMKLCDYQICIKNTQIFHEKLI